MPAILRSLSILGLSALVGSATPLAAQLRELPPRRSRGPEGFLFRAPRVTIGVRGGFNLQRSNSAIYTFVTDTLTLDRDDFNALSIAGDVGVRLAGPVDLVVGAGYSRTSAPSEFRNYVDQNDLPITQRTRLTTVPLTAAAKLYLTPRGRRVGRFAWIPARFTPYVGAGGGLAWYRFEQRGSFVDYVDLSIFNDALVSEDWGPVGLAMAGADYGLATRVYLTAEVRYLLGKADLGGDFVQFDDGIDLSGFHVSAGIQVRL